MYIIDLYYTSVISLFYVTTPENTKLPNWAVILFGRPILRIGSNIDCDRCLILARWGAFYLTLVCNDGQNVGS